MFLYEKRNDSIPDPRQVATLARELDVNPVLAGILWQRGYDTPQKARAFLNPNLSALQDPMDLADMDKAVERIRRAIAAGERMTVYGDYDADGVCAASILVEALARMGAKVGYYIPERHREGYGLNAAAVETLAGAGVTLLITVDCGIASRDEVDLAARLGMEVIVTDHHQCPQQLPRAVAVINPKRPGQRYRFSGLCGAGVAGRLAQALDGDGALITALDLMALATVADLVPLVDENRAIVAQGLKRLNEGRRPGVRALCRAAGLSLGSLSAGQLAFQLGPRINAGGRMDVSSKSVELFTISDEERAQTIARELDEDNARRKAVGERIAAQALEWVHSQVDLSREYAVVLASDTWDSGVQGIVASRLVETYHRPAVLLTREEDRYVGSARSIKGIHLYHVLEGCADLLERFGGHEMAAGMSLLPENLPAFRERLNQVLGKTAAPELFVPRKYYDLELALSQVQQELAEQLACLAPTGLGNPAPVFRVKADLEQARPMGAEGSHFRARLRDDGADCAAVAFSMEGPREPGRQDVLLTPQLNQWQGRTSLQCQINAFQPAVESFARAADALDPALWADRALSQLALCTISAPEIPIGRGDMDWLRRESFGTLVLAHGPKAAEGLDPALLLHVQAGDTRDAVAAQNTLVLAPDYEVLGEQGGRWRRLLLLDRPWMEEGIKILAGRLHCDEIGIIMETNIEGCRPSWPEFGPEMLRGCYVKLRRMLTAGGAFASREQALRRAAGAMELSDGRARLVLAIFDQLGVVRDLRQPPYLAPVPGAKVSLEDSVIYRRALASFQGGPEKPAS